MAAAAPRAGGTPKPGRAPSAGSKASPTVDDEELAARLEEREAELQVARAKLSGCAGAISGLQRVLCMPCGSRDAQPTQPRRRHATTRPPLPRHLTTPALALHSCNHAGWPKRRRRWTASAPPQRRRWPNSARSSPM